jgi:hypothetical protein
MKMEGASEKRAAIALDPRAIAALFSLAPSIFIKEWMNRSKRRLCYRKVY